MRQRPTAIAIRGLCSRWEKGTNHPTMVSVGSGMHRRNPGRVPGPWLVRMTSD